MVRKSDSTESVRVSKIIYSQELAGPTIRNDQSMQWAPLSSKKWLGGPTESGVGEADLTRPTVRTQQNT